MSTTAAPTAPAHGHEPASPWVRRWTHLVPQGGTVLDLACGGGRHSRWFAAQGARVTGVDRNAEALAGLTGVVHTVLADIEAGPWPLPGQTFDAVVVTNYLWRALLPCIVDSVAPGGVLIYETFAAGNETVGRPSNPDFLLREGELLDAVRPALRVVAYEDGFVDRPARFIQRIAAIRPHPGAAAVRRHLLAPGGD
jgi:SAM-dependent methyltransferase